MNEIIKTVGGLVFGLILVWWYFSPSAEEVKKQKNEAAKVEAAALRCNDSLEGNAHPRTRDIKSILTSAHASTKEKKAAMNEACDDYGLLTQRFWNFKYPDIPLKESVRRAHEEAEQGNRQADQAMEDMIESYRKRAKNSNTSATAAARIDTFEMPNGSLVICKTTFRNGARATTCN